jgi:hypothetical protein
MQGAGDQGACGAQGAEEEEEEEEVVADDAVIPMPGWEQITVGAAVVGAGEGGFRDGAATEAMFGGYSFAMLCLLDGRVLVVDSCNHRIRVLSADLQQVGTVAGDGEAGYRDGAATQAQFRSPSGLALLSDGRVLVADEDNHRIRVLSADLQQVSTVAGECGRGHRDGAAVFAQFNGPSDLALLPDGRVLVGSMNDCVRVLSADLQQVSTVTVDFGEGHRHGAAAPAQFNSPRGLALLPDGRVLVADSRNNIIRVQSADLQQVSTVAGDGEEGHRDGAAVQAQFNRPIDLVLLPDGRVLVLDEYNAYIRVLSADLQQVSTVTTLDELVCPDAFVLLPDGRLLVADSRRIHVLEGFPGALLGAKPSYKRPKKSNQQQQEEKKRALAGGASSTGRLVPKRNRSGATSSSMAAAPSSSDSEGEEQPGGSAAEAEPLV